MQKNFADLIPTSVLGAFLEEASSGKIKKATALKILKTAGKAFWCCFVFYAIFYFLNLFWDISVTFDTFLCINIFDVPFFIVNKYIA